MKKLVVMGMVTIMMVSMLVGCGNSSAESNNEPTNAVFVETDSKDLVVDDYKVGSVLSYAEYSVLECDSAAGYMIFLEYAKENNIEIIDISIATSRGSNSLTETSYFVTYKN